VFGLVGIDVHKDFLEVAYRDSSGRVLLREFDNTASGLDKLIRFLKANGVSDVYFESTGVYYFALYYALKGAGFRPHVLNAYKVKRPDANKTDERDAVWLLKVGESKLFSGSYVPDEFMQLLRFLTRKKAKIVDRMADIKREMGSVLSRFGLNVNRLGSKLASKKRLGALFRFINGKLDPSEMDDEVIRAFREVLDRHGGAYYFIVIETYLEELRLLKSKIERLNQAICHLSKPYKESLKILMSVPGISFDLAVRILAEIGDINRFPSPKHLVSYAGLAPTSRNSGGKTRYGKPTRKSNKRLRHYMFLAALAAVRSKSPRVRDWFDRLNRRGKPYKKIIVAIARKLLSIIWHLLVKEEVWMEEGYSKPLSREPRYRKPRVSIREAISILREAGYIVKKLDT